MRQVSIEWLPSPVFIVTLGAFAYNKIMFEFIPVIGSRAKAACKPQGNQLDL